MSINTNSATPAARRLGRPSKNEIASRQANLLQVASDQFMQHGYRATTMSQIADAANLTKQTLYAWHGDKAALFLACLGEGAQRYPLPDIDMSKDIATALRDYVIALMAELTSEYSLNFSFLLLREGRDFPELGAAVDRSVTDFLEEPLAQFFRCHGLEPKEADENAILFLALALAPLHNQLLFGRALPSDQDIAKHAAAVVRLFIQGCVHLKDRVQDERRANRGGSF